MGIFTRTTADGREMSAYEARVIERAEIPVGAKEISTSRYNLIMGLTVAYGLVMNAIMVVTMAEPIRLLLYGIHPIFICLGYIAPALLGAYIANKSDKPIISFLGYNLIVLPFGIMLCLIIPSFSTEIVARAMALTAFITLFMMGLGTAFPSFFLSKGRALVMALIVTLIVEIISVFIFGYEGILFDAIFVLIFSLYIAYDIARSQVYAHTVDNAVDSAVDIYLDIINLFTRILSLHSKRR